MMEELPRLHCPKCLFDDLYQMPGVLMRCEDCGFTFLIDEAIVGVDPET